MPANNEVSLKITVDDQASKVLNNAVRQLQKLQSVAKNTATSFKSITTATSRLNKSLGTSTTSSKSLQSQLGRLRTELGKTERATGDNIDSMLDYSAALAGVGQSLNDVGDFGARALRGFIESGSRLEQLETSYTSLLGSVDKARVAITQLREAAQDPGLTFEAAARGTRRFVSLGISVEESIELMRGLSNAAALSGTSLDQMEEGARQLFQALSRGKLEQEDLNSITERFGTIARQVREEYGKTAEEINNALAEQGMSVLDFAKDITSLEGAPKASADTLANAFSNLNNAFTELSAAVGKELIPFVKSVTTALTDLLEGFNKLSPEMKAVVGYTIALGTALATVGGTILTVSAGIGTLSVALGGAGGLAATGGAAAAGISSLTAAFTALAPIVGSVALSIAAIVLTLDKINESARNAGVGVGGLGKIASVTTSEMAKAQDQLYRFDRALREAGGDPVEIGNLDENVREMGVAIQISTEEMQSLVDAADDGARALLAVDGAALKTSMTLREFDFSLPPPPTEQRPIGTTPRDAGLQIDFDQQIQDAMNAEREHIRITRETTVTAGDLWDGLFKQIDTGVNRTENHWERASNNLGMLVRGAYRGQEQADEKATQLRLENQRIVSQATEKFNRLQRQERRERAKAERDSLNAARQTRREQEALLRSISSLSSSLSEASRGFAELSETADGTLAKVSGFLSKLAKGAGAVASIAKAIQGISSSERRGTGATGVINTLGGIVSIVGNIASVAALFHDPAQDRLARLAGQRAAGGQLPIGAIRQHRRQSAVDFSEHFGRGFERETTSQTARSAGEGIIQIQNNLIVDDRVVQRTTNVINRLEQSGRASLRR